MQFLAEKLSGNGIYRLQGIIFVKIYKEITAEKIRAYHLELRKSWVKPEATEEQRKALIGDDDDYEETDQIINDYINSKILEYVKVAVDKFYDFEESLLIEIENELNKL